MENDRAVPLTIKMDNGVSYYHKFPNRKESLEFPNPGASLEIPLESKKLIELVRILIDADDCQPR